jgi:tetratricopeptide (TPR) repeat protein
MREHLLKAIAVVFLATAFYVIPGPAFGQSNEEAILYRAWDLYDNEEYEACLKELKAFPFEKEEPGAEPYYLLGLCQYELENFKASIESFGMSMQKDPKMIENYFDRGYAYWANSQYKEAAANFEMSQKKNKGKMRMLNFTFNWRKRRAMRSKQLTNERLRLSTRRGQLPVSGCQLGAGRACLSAWALRDQRRKDMNGAGQD